MTGAWNVLWICDFRGGFIRFEIQFEIHMCNMHAFAVWIVRKIDRLLNIQMYFRFKAFISDIFQYDIL